MINNWQTYVTTKNTHWYPNSNRCHCKTCFEKRQGSLNATPSPSLYHTRQHQTDIENVFESFILKLIVNVIFNSCLVQRMNQ